MTENYNFNITRDVTYQTVDGPALRETWTKDGALHRISAPAVIIRHPYNNEVYVEEFYSHGMLHRDDGPARFSRDVLGTWRRTEFFQMGRGHRESGPAAVTVDTGTGLIISEIYRRHGKLDREDGPAVVYRDPETGVATEVSWHRQGRLHRLGGPALIKRDAQTGVARSEDWFDGGQHHNASGLASIYRDASTGVIKSQRFFLKGRQQPSLEKPAHACSPEPSAD